MELSVFRYHPDPVGSGSVVPSDASCQCCDEARGFVYDGPVYSEEDVDAVCPWCIASGEAHEKFDATFVDSEAFADGTPESAMDEIVEHMAHDSLVGWGWHPGDGRAPAPGTQAAFGKLTQAWVDSGARCPA